MHFKQPYTDTSNPNPWWTVYSRPKGDGKDFTTWFRTAKNFVGLKVTGTPVPTGQTVLFYFNTAPNLCGAGYLAQNPVPSNLWFELNDMAASANSFRVNVANTLTNGARQFPSGDTYMMAAISTNSGVATVDQQFVVSEVGVYIGGNDHTQSSSYYYVLGDTSGVNTASGNNGGQAAVQ